MGAIFIKGAGGGASAIEADLLWENNTPTASRDSFTLNLDLSEYDAVIVKARAYTDDATTNYGIAFRNQIPALIAVKYGSDTRANGRRITAFTDTALTFSRGFVGASGNNQNAACIPLEVYGIRINGVA